MKNGFHLPSSKMTSTDLNRLLTCRAVRSVLRPRRMDLQRKRSHVKKNPLKNMQVLIKLNPNAISERNARIGQQKAALRRKKTKSKSAPQKVLKEVKEA
ncbi:hypothetical protein EXU34_23925, partial [Alteromonas sp. ZYF713]|nr:hypothetical protein [Alteromonas sp. ZYF713]